MIRSKVRVAYHQAEKSPWRGQVWRSKSSVGKDPGDEGHYRAKSEVRVGMKGKDIFSRVLALALQFTVGRIGQLNQSPVISWYDSSGSPRPIFHDGWPPGSAVVSTCNPYIARSGQVCIYWLWKHYLLQSTY
jgi:hypothetical protein